MTYNIWTEFENLDYPNFLIPAFIYHFREEHYKYWELSWLSRNKNALFSFYEYDPEHNSMHYHDHKGKHFSEKNNLNVEWYEMTVNPLFEKYIWEYR